MDTSRPGCPALPIVSLLSLDSVGSALQDSSEDIYTFARVKESSEDKINVYEYSLNTGG